MGSKIERKGGFWVSGTYYPNSLLQSAFDMLADFMTGGESAPPGKIGIMDGLGEMIALKDASFSQNPFTAPAVGVTVRADVIFSADEVTADIAAFALTDTNGILLALAEVDPPVPAATGIVVTREDVISEAP